MLENLTKRKQTSFVCHRHLFVNFKCQITKKISFDYQAEGPKNLEHCQNNHKHVNSTEHHNHNISTNIVCM